MSDLDTKEYIELLRLRAVNTALLDACAGMVGLVRLLMARDDLPSELRQVLATNHRIVVAEVAIAHARDEVV